MLLFLPSRLHRQGYPAFVTSSIRSRIFCFRSSGCGAIPTFRLTGEVEGFFFWQKLRFQGAHPASPCVASRLNVSRGVLSRPGKANRQSMKTRGSLQFSANQVKAVSLCYLIVFILVLENMQQASPQCLQVTGQKH